MGEDLGCFGMVTVLLVQRCASRHRRRREALGGGQLWARAPEQAPDKRWLVLCGLSHSWRPRLAEGAIGPCAGARGKPPLLF
eukprot:13753593-Alexandrium_andersonii.AAC.1